MKWSFVYYVVTKGHANSIREKLELETRVTRTRIGNVRLDVIENKRQIGLISDARVLTWSYAWRSLHKKGVGLHKNRLIQPVSHPSAQCRYRPRHSLSKYWERPRPVPAREPPVNDEGWNILPIRALTAALGAVGCSSCKRNSSTSTSISSLVRMNSVETARSHWRQWKSAKRAMMYRPFLKFHWREHLKS